MKKITILALHLGYGGIEKSISSIANAFCDEYEVTIVSTYKLYDKPSFFVDPKVSIKYLLPNLKPNHAELKQAIESKNPFKILLQVLHATRILRLRKKRVVAYIKQCSDDVIISTRDMHNKWLGRYGKKDTVKIGWEHNHHNNDDRYINKVVSSAKKLDYLVLVSEKLADFYHDRLSFCSCKTIAIPNSINKFTTSPAPLNEKRIISVGRLSKEKGYNDLVDVFSFVHKQYPDWKLDIVGDGLERDFLNNKICDLRLDKSITLRGFQNSDYIDNMLRKSSIYIMCSHTESFGIVLVEAFSNGVPCIAFDSAQGASEIIDNSINGYLIANRSVKEMVNKICLLISNYNLRRQFGLNGFNKSKEYQIENVKRIWIKLFEHTF